MDFNGLELPVCMYSFFNAESLIPGKILGITLIYKNSGINYSSCIRKGKYLDENRIFPTHIYWDEGLGDLIEKLVLNANDGLILTFVKSASEKNKYYFTIEESSSESESSQLIRAIPENGDHVLPAAITKQFQENDVGQSLAIPEVEAEAHFTQPIDKVQILEKNAIQMDEEDGRIPSPIKLSQKQRIYAEILTKEYPSGINLNNKLQFVRYKTACEKAFSERYQKGWVMDDDQFLKEIQVIIIPCDNSSWLSIKSLNISDSLLNEIIVQVNILFESGKTIVSSDELYINFKQRLLHTNIYNSTTLKNVLRYYLNDKYIFVDDYIYFEKVPNVDNYIFETVLATLKEFSGPISYKELIRKLSHFPEEKIKDCLSNSPEVIRGKKGYYTHIDCFDITLQDKELLLTTCCKNMDGNVMTTIGLFYAYQKINTDFFDRNIVTDIVTLGDIFESCYPSRFTYKRGQIILGDGPILSSTERVTRYLMSMKSFTYYDMEEYAKSNHHNVACRGVLKPILQEYLRLDENRFVSIDQLNIPQKVLNEIENLLMDELQVGYACSANIKNYQSYPYIGTNPCTPHLLESIVRIYGSKFKCPLKIIDYFTGCKKPRGIIVRLNSDFTTYTDILVDVLKKQNSRDPFVDQMQAIEYLKERNYMETTPRDGLSRIYSKAIGKY